VNRALWCIVSRRLQLPCCCTAWLNQRLAGSQSQQQHREVPLQFSVSEQTGEGKRRGREEIQRCKEDQRREQGQKRREALKKQVGERGIRGRIGNGRRL